MFNIGLNKINGLGYGVTGPAPMTLTYVADVDNDFNSSITIPATAAAGDLCMIVDTVANFSSSTTLPTATNPSGWTKQVDEASNLKASNGTTPRGRQVIYTKVLTSGDPGSSITTMGSGAPYPRAGLIVYRPSTTIGSVTWYNDDTHNVINVDTDALSTNVSDNTAALLCGVLNQHYFFPGSPTTTGGNPVLRYFAAISGPGFQCYMTDYDEGETPADVTGNWGNFNNAQSFHIGRAFVIEVSA